MTYWQLEVLKQMKDAPLSLTQIEQRLRQQYDGSSWCNPKLKALVRDGYAKRIAKNAANVVYGITAKGKEYLDATHN